MIDGLPSLRGRRSLREEITTLLRAAVMAGELEPGVVYSAPRLAEQFGVSATPVREAMLDLDKEGLVEIVRNRGFRVTRLTATELDDITQIRAMLEVPAVRAIAERVLAGQRAEPLGTGPGAEPCAGPGTGPGTGPGADVAEALAALRPLATGIEDAARRRDFIAHVAIDMEFHLGLLALTANARLVEIVRTLRTSSRLFGLKHLTEGSALFDTSHEHAELLDLVLAGDADGAEALMRQHIGHVRGIWAEPAPGG